MLRQTNKPKKQRNRCAALALKKNRENAAIHSANAPAQVRERVGTLRHWPAHGLVGARARETTSRGTGSRRTRRRRSKRLRRGSSSGGSSGRRRGSAAVSLWRRGARRLFERSRHGDLALLSVEEKERAVSPPLSLVAFLSVFFRLSSFDFVTDRAKANRQTTTKASFFFIFHFFSVVRPPLLFEKGSFFCCCLTNFK